MDKTENVARVIFSPQMIYNGELLPEAFRLRAILNEEYLSVMRMSVSSWKEDILLILQRRNRMLYGYAQMKVADILDANFQSVKFDVRACDNKNIKSHAGIFITVNDEPLIGGKSLKSINDDDAQDFLLLTIQRRLTDIARKGLQTLTN